MVTSIITNMKINALKHPTYNSMLSKWSKWRLTFEGGDAFLNAYLKKFSKREDTTDFRIRKSITYVPAFAKTSIIDIKNAIFQRASDTVRMGGSNSYSNSMVGEIGGVDLKGSTMDAFIGQEVLGELLTMSEVGVYIDMPNELGDTLADVGNKHPYMYTYKAEDILNWSYDDNYEFTALLLRAHVYKEDKEFGLPVSETIEYRYFSLVDGKVRVDTYKNDGTKTSTDLGIDKIPFVMLKISNSLLADVANYQIAHLNLASSDVYYAWKSNYPFYTEQYDPKVALRQHLQQSTDGTTATTGDKAEIETGLRKGRKYPINTERPAFINPSPDPLKVSMEKQDKMKEEVRELVNLSLAGIKAKMVSAESRSIENEGLEAGLANIGLVLETAERKIADYWHLYENIKNDAIIRYPEHYQLKTDETRNKEAKTLTDFITFVPSKTYQKELAKSVADLTIGHKISLSKMDIIKKEVDSADIIISDPKTILASKEAGLVSDRTASELLGYPEGEAKDAAIDHANRLARIQAAQTPADISASGVPDAITNPDQSKIQKMGKPVKGDSNAKTKTI